MAELLIDTFSFTPKILENSSGNGRLVVEGVFQKADVKNANGRIYPRKLWEKTLKDQSVLSALTERKMLGNVDHPADSTPKLKGASHIVTFLEIQSDGTVVGKAEILETEDGKLIKELLEAGVPVGISSRAKGSLSKGPDGCYIVQESDFKLLTFDFVAAPSTPGAYPKVINEETDEENNNIQENYMSAREKFNQLEQKAATVLCLKNADLTESTKPFVDSTIADLVIDLTKLSTEAPELRGLTESLIHNLNTKRNGFKFDLVEAFPFQKKDEDEDEDDEAEDKKKKKKKKGADDEEKEVSEDTKGSADQGFVRTVPMEPPPPPGEGWPINPGDAGVLADINASVNNFMEGKEDESDIDEETRVQALTNIALALIQLQETENNAVARAYAAAYLVEHERRVTENQAYQRVVGKLQEKLEEGAKTGKIVLAEEDSDLRNEHTKLLEAFDELQTRHRLLAAKVYALQELDKAGLKDNNTARKVIAEAIQKSPSKKSIDEAILALASVKGMKSEKKEITESVQNIEGSVAKLNESTSSAESYGLNLAKRLSSSLSYSRAN